MEEHYERRKNDTRISDIEKNIALGDQDHLFIKEILRRIECKLDKYNGIRERIDSLEVWRKYANGGFMAIVAGGLVYLFEVLIKK